MNNHVINVCELLVEIKPQKRTVSCYNKRVSFLTTKAKQKNMEHILVQNVSCIL